jgi:hypothetical protein
MSTVTASYFHSASLRQRFLNELDLALSIDRLQPAEKALLESLALAPARSLSTLDPAASMARESPLRVDRLLLEDGTLPSLELRSALLISQPHIADARIYLVTLAGGIKVFDNRQQLLSALTAGFAHNSPSAAYEYERIEGDVFVAQMRAIVEFQVNSLRHFSEQFRLAPGLFGAVTSALQVQLQRLMPHLNLDAATQLMRIVQPASGADTEVMLTTQTLAQVAFEDICGVEQMPGAVRQYLDNSGRILSAADAGQLDQALRETVKALPEHFAQQLEQFWSGSADAQPMREMARQRYTASLLHTLYGQVHTGTVSAQESALLQQYLWPTAAAAGADARCVRLKLHWGDGVATPLAGTFACVLKTSAGSSVLWFTPEHAFRRFEGIEALTAWCSTPEGRELLRPTLALQDQNRLLQAGALELSLETIAEPLLAERVESILTMQARNLQWAWGVDTQPEKRSAMIDDALDVRPLLDPCQQHFSAGRWSRDTPLNFARSWARPDADDLIQVGSRIDPSETVLSIADSEPSARPTAQQLAPSWLERTEDSDAGAAHLRQLDNVLLGYAEQVLQAYVCVASGTRLLARDVRVRWLESSPVDASDVETGAVVVSESLEASSMDLVSLLLERVSGHRCTPVAAGAQTLLQAGSPDTSIDLELINFAIEHAAVDFIARYLERFKQSRAGVARLGDRQLQPVAVALGLREDALRLDLALRQRMAVLTESSIDVVRQMLDAPVRKLRTAGSAITEVFTLVLVCGDAPGIAVSDCLMLWQPENAAAGVLLWVGSHGWRRYDSVQVLSEKVLGAFRGAYRERWLRLLDERGQRVLRNLFSTGADGSVRLRLVRVEGHAIEALQQTIFNRQQQNLEQLCVRARRCRFEARLFADLARSTELDDQLVVMLDSLALRLDGTLFEELLPEWLRTASITDLKTYNGIWRRYYLATSDGEDFLFGIPPLGDYARNRLLEQFARDFPEKHWDPDQITITLRRYIPGFAGQGQIPSGIAAATLVNSESLTDYALNRFVNIQDGMLTVASVRHPDAVGLLTPHYLRGMVRHVDVGTRFLALLRRSLNPAAPDWSRRLKLFVDQFPPMLQAVAMQQKLEGTLSRQAYAFISRIVEMPDGIARVPVDDNALIISPLRLVADQGMTPDTVKGVYLICPRDLGKGPVVLHAIVHSDFVFCEYPDMSALLADIRRDQSLQQMLLERLDPEVRKRYEHGGFSEPHLPFFAESFGDVPTRVPRPVTVSLAEEKGNALHLLFNDTVDLLIDMGVANTVTTAQADQASSRFLGLLGLEQVLSLLPGKLATMVALWQSHTLFRASAVSASGRRWGEALSEFSAALGVMAAAREQADRDDLIAGELATGEALVPTTFEWAGLRLTAEQLGRLHALQARSVSLSDLKRDELLSLYRDARTEKTYAAVGGRVYQVQRRSRDGRWLITGENGAQGPALKLDAHQRWQLDLDAGLQGGGGLLTKMRAEGAETTAEDALIIEASGMPEIRKVYRERALNIGEAHLQAKRYLENCLDNLNVHAPQAPVDARVLEIIGDFFGVHPPGQDLLIETEHVIKALFDEVMDASLSPYSSPRYVVGSTRPGNETTVAFIIKSDPNRRVFLTERFFNVPPFALRPSTPDFDMPAHHRAATLIHELSHQVLGTHDIAYLETAAPYPDLILGDTANDSQLKADLERLQNEGLSHTSHRADLFVHMKDGEWGDLSPEDSQAYNAVLTITNTRTLEEARQVFLSDAQKRSRVLLANADSVTLLILRLGRHNFVMPTP